jgi:hypothetical protein
MPSLGSYLQSAASPGYQLKDFAHASRLYLDDVYALAPKAGWLYYVVFDIEPSAITDDKWANQQRVSEVGMLVKSCDLPKFTIQTETMNQYNRKTVVQKGVTYNPVNVTMHDDQSNVVHNMWLNYYRYYYADSTWGGTGPIGTARDNTPGAYQSNKYLPANDLFNPVNYGLNSKLTVAPFFRSITIYQLNRKIFTSYQLVNPMITQWEHDKLDQTAGNRLAESKMGIAYEAVFYGVGQVKKDTPTGFAMFHYDTSPSPLSIAGGGNNSIFGPGGIIPGALEVFGDVSGMMSPDSQISPLGVLGTVIKGANLVKNIKGVTKESLRAEGYKIINSTLQKVAQGSLNGLGVNLNLNKGNNYATAGQFLGTPVAVVTAAAVAGGFGDGTVSQTGSSPNGTPPGSADPSSASGIKSRSLQQAKSTVDGTKFNGTAAEDASPEGATPADGTYFTAPEPLIDTDPFQRPEIDENSAEEDIQAALNDLNSSWAADNEFVSGQTPDTNVITEKLNNAASYEEYVAIKQNADDVLVKTQEVQASVDSKYSAEHQRLTSLLQSVRGNTSGADSVQLTPDDENPFPAEESNSTPIDLEDF